MSPLSSDSPHIDEPSVPSGQACDDGLNESSADRKSFPNFSDHPALEEGRRRRSRFRSRCLIGFGCLAAVGLALWLDVGGRVAAWRLGLGEPMPIPDEPVVQLVDGEFVPAFAQSSERIARPLRAPMTSVEISFDGQSARLSQLRPAHVRNRDSDMGRLVAEFGGEGPVTPESDVTATIVQAGAVLTARVEVTLEDPAPLERTIPPGHRRVIFSQPATVRIDPYRIYPWLLRGHSRRENIGDEYFPILPTVVPGSAAYRPLSGAETFAIEVDGSIVVGVEMRLQMPKEVGEFALDLWMEWNPATVGPLQTRQNLGRYALLLVEPSD